jgi:biotin operon repressor
MGQQDGRLVRQADAARALGINRATVSHHIYHGGLTVETVGGVRFVTRASLTKLLRKRAARAAKGAK